MTNTISVRTFVQKVLLEKELQGQISDGFWENAYPMNHWKSVCSAEVEVDPSNVGLNFYAMKVSYNFTNPQLLECVAERMLFAVKIALYIGENNYDKIEDISIPDSVENFIQIKRYALEGDKYYAQAYSQLREVGINDESIYEIEQVNFTYKQMLNELRDLKKVFKSFSK